MRFSCLFLALFLSLYVTAQHTTINVILDTDTANEIDDLYAIARTVPEEKFRLLGVNSAQWFHYYSGDSTVFASQRLNEEMIELLQVKGLPLPLGSDEAFGMPWGGTEARSSEAAQFIIDQAHQIAANDSLVVICIGAATNLASAIKIAPDIVPKLRVYVLGFQYDWEKEIWNKDEFNIRRDLNAANFLLNTEGLDLHIMPISVAIQLKFDQEETFKKQGTMGKLGAYMTQKWKERFPKNATWIMWDLALIEAILFPEWAPQKQVLTPPENVSRQVWMYQDIEAQKMQEEYWQFVSKLGRN